MRYRFLNTIGPVFAPEAKEILKKIADVDYKIVSQEQISDEILSYDAVICGLSNNFSEDVLKQTNRLKYIATATTGLDHIDLNAAKKNNVEIVSLRDEEEFLNTITGTAELAFGLMLMLARKIPEARDAVLKGEWKREDLCGRSLRGATLGIIGLGRLGKMMASYGTAFGMKIIYHDPKVHHDSWQKEPFENLIEQSDYVSIHVHLSKETEHMFDCKALASMKKSAFLINTSRGKIVDESALLDSLKSEDIAGYATDVLDGELLFGKYCGDHPLIVYAQNHSNVICVPHIGGMTYESRRDTDIFIAEKLVNAFNKNKPTK